MRYMTRLLRHGADAALAATLLAAACHREQRAAVLAVTTASPPGNARKATSLKTFKVSVTPQAAIFRSAIAHAPSRLQFASDRSKNRVDSWRLPVR